MHACSSISGPIKCACSFVTIQCTPTRFCRLVHNYHSETNVCTPLEIVIIQNAVSVLHTLFIVYEMCAMGHNLHCGLLTRAQQLLHIHSIPKPFVK